MMIKMNAVASKTESRQYNTHTNICCRCVIVSANKEPDTVSRSMEFANLVLSHFLATNLPPTKKVKCVLLFRQLLFCPTCRIRKSSWCFKFRMINETSLGRLNAIFWWSTMICIILSCCRLRWRITEGRWRCKIAFLRFHPL